MYNVREYTVFYLLIENLWQRDDFASIGVKEVSWEKEMAIRKDYVDGISNSVNIWNIELMKEESYARGVGEFTVKTQHFGPLLLFYLPNQNKESIKAMYALAAISLPRILRKLGMKGRFVRGAFIKGYGWEIAANGCHTLYGPVMHKAWYVMNDLAYSPRIIIEQDILNIVSDRHSYGSGPNGEWLSRYARRDYDGQGIFDYLTHDIDSPSVRHDTKEVVIKEMMEMLRVILRVNTALVPGKVNHDNSSSIRMSLALSDYLQYSLSLWTGKREKDILSEALGSEVR